MSDNERRIRRLIRRLRERADLHERHAGESEPGRSAYLDEAALLREAADQLIILCPNEEEEA